MKASYSRFTLFALPDRWDASRRATGENEKGIIIVFTAEGDERDRLLNFLRQILKAVNLDMERDVALLNLTSGERVSLDRTLRQTGSSRAVLFGCMPAQLGLHFRATPYQLLHHRQKTYLFADDLGRIHQERQRGEKAMAGALWQALQNMFF